ncbi:succinic semialdehyde dehydrogenase [Cellulomonas taurus]|uniref:succinic semialdehyde dehydrogenase n=1 Tax=Cellulomonas taurus TaxID=2729175 RepID=UPI00145C797E|nr:succinic semialdehyde dehydrogenase [Cellulomonas taurus]
MVPEALRDPETDPLATLVLEPELLTDLVARARATGVLATHHAPWTGAPLASLPQSTPADLTTAARAARVAGRRWAATDHRHRARLLRRAADLLLARQSDVLDLIQLENGKARASAVEEVADVVLGARFLARNAGRVLAADRRPGLAGPLTSVRVAHDPAGVVGIVAPWNYPLSLTLGDVLPAVAAGNAVLLRPDPQTPLTALWAVELLADAGFPADLVQVVLGDGPTVGDGLIDHVDHLLFTGSTPTGRMVAARAGAALVPSTLELGGKNALYIAEDADPELAAEGAVRACFGGTGQLCMSVERIYLHHELRREFLDAFRRRVRALRLGTGLDYGYDVGSLTGAGQLARVVAHVEDALSAGARVLTGGVHRPEIGPFVYEPTVLTAVGPQARVLAEETFGPVVTVHEVRSDDEAVAAMNDTPYGLHAAVWSRDTRRARRIADRLRVGSVDVNDGYQMSWGSWAAPQGGRAASGWGVRHGAEGLLALTRSRTVAVQHGVHRGLGPGRLLSTPGWAPLLLRALAAGRPSGPRRAPGRRSPAGG